MLFYKFEISKEECSKLDSKLSLKTDELNRVKEELRQTQNEALNWEAKVNRLIENIPSPQKRKTTVKVDA